MGYPAALEDSKLRIAAVVTMLLLFAGCQSSAKKSEGPIAEPGPVDTGSVMFNIQPLQTSGDSQQWEATYTAGGRTAKFKLELGPGKAQPAKTSEDFPIKFGKGKFIAESGSDATALLLALKKSLEAKTMPTGVSKVASLPFTYANLGEKMSRDPNGGFSGNPPGDWIAMKIFLGESDEEVFLNLNSVLGKAEFAEKDPDYGDGVLAELAKVL